MRYDTATFTVRFPVFEPGERIVHRHSGRILTARRTRPPTYPEDEAFVYVDEQEAPLVAGDCDPFIDSALPVAWTMDRGDGRCNAWAELPGGDRYAFDEDAGWTDFASARSLVAFESPEAALRSVREQLRPLGFDTVQHRPL